MIVLRFDGDDDALSIMEKVNEALVKQGTGISFVLDETPQDGFVEYKLVTLSGEQQ